MTSDLFNKRKKIDNYQYIYQLKNGFKNGVNMKWILHNIYLDYEPNIALKALYDMESEILKYKNDLKSIEKKMKLLRY